MNADLSSRHYFLDWLRLLAVLGVVVFHVAMFFGPWGWHIKHPETLPWLEMPMDIAHRLRMPLLFVIAGAALTYSLRRRSLLAVLKERTRRLLVPLVFGILVIVPPQIYVERVVHGQFSGDYLDYYLTRVLQFMPYPAGDFSWHHLWFIAYLLLYVWLFGPVLAGRKNSATRRRPGWWLLVLALPLGLCEALLRTHFPERHSLLNDWWVLGNYALLLLYGAGLARLEGGWDWLAVRRHRLLALMLLTVAAILPLKAAGLIVPPDDAGRITQGAVLDALSANLFVWCALLALLGYGKHWLDRAEFFGRRWREEARAFAYPLYLLHQSLIILLAWPLIAAPWPIAWKALALFGGTLIISALCYRFLIRPWASMRWLFGLPAKPREIARKASASPSEKLSDETDLDDRNTGLVALPVAGRDPVG